MEKSAKDVNREFTEREQQNIHEHIKECPTHQQKAEKCRVKHNEYNFQLIRLAKGKKRLTKLKSR